LLAVGLTLVPLGVISLVFLIGPMLVFFVARWYYALYFRKLECVLTERKLHVGKGLLFRTEKAIPLDKVTDLSMNQGPLLRWMNLEAMGLETAGQSNAQGGALVRLVGIEGSRDFREAVLDQRDRVVGTADAHGATSERGAGVGTDAATGTRSTDDESVALLREIRDSLRRIEGRADRAAPNEPMAKLQE
jgi:putative membrane protein